MAEAVQVLISIKTYSTQGTGPLRRVLKSLARDFALLSVSSVYKVNRPAESFVGLRDIRKEERLDALAMVVRAATTLNSRKALDAIAGIEAEHQKEFLRRTISLNLMVYGSEITMLPGLALPHPELHLRPEEVVPAVEVWADYEHPVLKESLFQLSRNFSKSDWGEFFAQGSPLLDF